MGVQVDTARGDNQSSGIQHLFGIAGVQTADLGNLPILDAEVTLVARDTGAVDDGAIFNNDIKLSHNSLLVEIVVLRFFVSMAHSTGDCQVLSERSFCTPR